MASADLPKLWKPFIISLTEGDAARTGKLDASFFPPCSEEGLLTWERSERQTLPPALRCFYLQSNGMEAGCGTAWPILPLERTVAHTDECHAFPFQIFGTTTRGEYAIHLREGQIYHRSVEQGLVFHSASLVKYLESYFGGKA